MRPKAVISRGDVLPGRSSSSLGLCIWENHPSTIDLQFIIEGIKGIDITPVAYLEEPTSFKPEPSTRKFAANYARPRSWF